MAGSELNHYLSEIGRHPVLSKEVQLLHSQRIWAWVNYEGGRDKAPKRVQRSGKRAMDIMIRTNLRLVVSIAKRYQKRGLDLPDLIQEGNIGLMQGLERFDPTRGYAITTYCYWWIRVGITRALHCQARMIRLPINFRELVDKVHKYTNQYMQDHGRQPTLEELSTLTKSSPARIKQVISIESITTCSSYDMPNNETGNSLIELLPDEGYLNEPEEELIKEEYYASLRAGLATLQGVESNVVQGVYYQKETLKELAIKHNFSRSRAGQYREAGINKLRKHLQQDGFWD